MNVDGHYNYWLLSCIDKVVGEGFISPTSRGIIVSAPIAKELFIKLEVINWYPIITPIVRQFYWQTGLNKHNLVPLNSQLSGSRDARKYVILHILFKERMYQGFVFNISSLRLILLGNTFQLWPF